MISASDGYREAVFADTRRTAVKVETDVVDPDIEFLSAEVTSEEIHSRKNQVYESHTEIKRYATLEHNFWILDGQTDILTDDYEPQESGDKVSWISEAVSDADGYFDAPQKLIINITYTGLLQAVSFYFSSDPANGFPRDFTVKVYVDDLVVAEWSKEDNTELFTEPPEPFEAYNPTSFEIEITRWSLSNRRARIRQGIPGFHLVWSGDDIADLNVRQNGDPSCVTMPYGTAKISVDNSKRTFEPRNKEGYFKSIQARQIVEVYIGVYVDGEPEYKSVGKFYQHSGGWSSSDYGLSIDWDLVDIIGLLATKKYVVPNQVPSTLNEWVGSVVSHLGKNFANRYSVDDKYKSLTISVTDKEKLSDLNCADVLRFLAIETGTWVRADAETGYLTLEPLWNQGVKINLHNQNTFPRMSENDDVGTISFDILGENETKVEFGGTNLAASKNVNISSPFMVDENAAIKAFQWIVTQCGGNAYDITWRGDPTCEIGDVVTFELSEQNACSARVIDQEFSYSSGVLANCSASLIQPIGFQRYANNVILTEDCAWTVPDGVHVLQIVLVGGGNCGQDGRDGDEEEDGRDGENGSGANVYHIGLNVRPGQSFAVTIGRGSNHYGVAPTETTFGTLSSGNGRTYLPSYTDINSGSAFGRTGIRNPLPNTGDGGYGGKGGKKGRSHTVKDKDDFGYVTERTVWDVRPTRGEDGSPGADGCVVIHY